MANNILITPASASIQFSGSAANTIRLVVEDSGSVAFYGDSGSLFGISDSLSGSLMSVNDISGLPTLETFSDGKLVVSPYAFQVRSMGFGTDTPIGNFDFVNPLAENVDFYIRTTQGQAYDTALHIRGSRTTSTTDELANIRFETADTDAGGVELARISAIKDVASTNIARLEFKTTSTDGGSPSTKMMISSSGNVGIGNTTPSHTLSVTGDISASGDVTASAFSGDGSQITGVVSADTASYIDGLISFPNGLDVTGSLLVDGDISASGTITGSAFFGDGSNITGIVSAQTASYIDGFVNFDQGIVVTGSLIASGGLAGIGEPNPSYDLDVNGIVRADAYYWDTAAPQQTPSDSRLKTKVTPLPPQSDRIRDVNLVEFEWSELNDTRPSRQNRTKRQGTKDVGVIAQEIQEIFPELVSEDVDGYLTVSYVGLLIPLIKTVQEQQKQIDELKKLISGEE